MYCVLHIGIPKTGSSSIQKFLDTNRGLLKHHGHIFTSALGERNNIKLPLLAYNEDHFDGLTTQFKICTKSDLVVFKEKWFSKLKRELNSNITHSTKRIIFSSEHLIRLNSDEIYRLKTILESLGINDFKIVIYLRDQYLWAISSASTAIKSGGCNLSIMPPTSSFVQNICDYKSVIKRWSKVFGMSTITPRLFQKDDLINGCIVQDFVHVLGLGSIANYTLPKRVNKSFTQAQAKLMAEVNKQLPRFVKNRPNPDRYQGFILEAIGQMDTGDSLRHSGLVDKNYKESFKKSNKWVCDKFFPDRDELFIPISTCDYSKPEQENQTSEYAKVLTFSFKKLGEIRKLCHPHIILRSAQHIEKTDLVEAYCLVLLCHEVGKRSPAILKKILEYESVIDRYFVPELPTAVFLFSGQSNMNGRGNPSNLLAGDMADETKLEYFYFGFRKLLDVDSFGPEVGFYTSTADLYARIAIAKYARDGESIEHWTSGKGLQRLTDAFFKVVNGKKAISVKALFWLQGERDTRSIKCANRYYQSLLDFIENVRSVVSCDLPIFIGRIDGGGNFIEEIRNTQYRITCDLDNCYLVDLDGITKNADNLHYDTPGLIEVGRRFAISYINSIAV